MLTQVQDVWLQKLKRHFKIKIWLMTMLTSTSANYFQPAAVQTPLLYIPKRKDLKAHSSVWVLNLVSWGAGAVIVCLFIYVLTGGPHRRQTWPDQGPLGSNTNTRLLGRKSALFRDSGSHFSSGTFTYIQKLVWKPWPWA